VPKRAEEEPEKGARRLLQRQERVRRVPGEEPSGLLAHKEPFGSSAGCQ